VSGGRVLRILGAAAASVAINLLVLGASDLLSRERPVPGDISEPMVVQLVTLPAPERPEPEREPPPEDPVQKPRLDFQPQLAAPTPSLPRSRPVEIPAPVLQLGQGLSMGGLVFVGSDLDEPPRAVVRTAPPYPYRARQRRVSGTVRVKLLVHADGTISDVEILASEPDGYFEDTVRRTVPSWRFEPGHIAGEPVASWVVTTVRFDMEGG